MTNIKNLATERARRDTESLLDAVDAIRTELEFAPPNEWSARLRCLVDQLAYVGISMLAATAVMAEDFERRFQKADQDRHLQRRRQTANPLQRSML